MNFFQEILSNRVFWVTFLAWALSCIIKGLLECIKQKRIIITRFLGSGGMPSSHSTIVMSLAVAVGLEQGFGTPLFAVCSVLALVVMYDASGIRRAAGQQAQMINAILDAWNENDPIEKQIKLKELLGHTPREVIAGAALGTLTSVIAYAIM